MPVLVWQTPTGHWDGQDLGLPHRYRGGSLSRTLGGMFPADVETSNDPDWLEVFSVDPFPPDCKVGAVIIASDGAWEPLIEERYGEGRPEPEHAFADTLAAVCGSRCWNADSLNADTVAHHILDKATTLGLKDNSTIAVALTA